MAERICGAAVRRPEAVSRDRPARSRRPPSRLTRVQRSSMAGVRQTVPAATVSSGSVGAAATADGGPGRPEVDTSRPAVTPSTRRA